MLIYVGNNDARAMKTEFRTQTELLAKQKTWFSMVHFQAVHCCLSPVLQKSKKARHSGGDMKNNVKHDIIRI